jgi:hypothetical protein
LSVKALVVPPLSRQQVLGQDLARRTHTAPPQPPPPARRPGHDDQALNMARSGRRFGGRSLGLPSAYISNLKLAIYF